MNARTTLRTVAHPGVCDDDHRLPTARFWVYVNGDFVRLRLRPGQSIERIEGGPCEEGWSRSATVWSFLDDYALEVLRECHDDGADCDGRYSRSEESRCATDSLASWRSPAEGAPMLPEWEPIGSHQRDYSAEAAGY